MIKNKLKTQYVSSQILGPITHSTHKLNKKTIVIYTCIIPRESVNLSYELKCILHKYLTFHINTIDDYKYQNTSFHISSITNILIISSYNINHILEILKAVKYVLNCTKFISKTIPKRCLNILNSK